MREFTIRKGNFAGKHNIYDTREEAIEHKVKEIKSPWHSLDVQVGDWVQADDGYVVQCLSRYKLPNKRARNGQFTDCFRFPMGTFYVYYGVRTNTVKNFYAHNANVNKTALGNTSKMGRFMTIRKKEFVLLMSMGYDPYSAYIKAFKVSKTTPGSIQLNINKLLDDPLIKEALMEALKPYMQQVQDKVKQITGYQDLNTLFVEKMAEILTKDYRDPRVTILAFKLGLDLFGTSLGLLAPSTATKQGIKEIQEASFKVMPPPQLGSVQ